MAHTKEYNEYVHDDLKKYEGLTRPLKASMLERVFTHKAKTIELHPNPDDEFSIPEIGPNYGIVKDYIQKFAYQQKFSAPGMTGSPVDRLIVEKIKPNGYMILNGHHRWFAARMTKQKTMWIKVVNVTHEDDILQAMQRTKNRICVSFDFDEVLLAPTESKNVEKKPNNPLAVGYHERIREGVPALIDALHNLGCDIWVYTGTYASEKYISSLLRLYQVRVDGIVNGMKNRKSEGSIAGHFKERYDVSIHVDTESVTCVDTKNKTYEIVDLKNGPVLWASEVIGLIRGMDAVKGVLK